MFIEERQQAIEKVLREQGKVRVRELSEMFQVTEDCIRKDLKTLENAGKLKRTYGGAILSQDLPAGKRCYRQKKLSCGKENGDCGQGHETDPGKRGNLSGYFHNQY